MIAAQTATGQLAVPVGRAGHGRCGGQPRRNNDNQFGGVRADRLRAEQHAQQRNILDDRQAGFDRFALVAVQPGNHDGLAVANLNRGLGPAHIDDRDLDPDDGQRVGIRALRHFRAHGQHNALAVNNRWHKVQQHAVFLVFENNCAVLKARGQGVFSAGKKAGRLARNSSHVGPRQHRRQAGGGQRVYQALHRCSTGTDTGATEQRCGSSSGQALRDETGRLAEEEATDPHPEAAPDADIRQHFPVEPQGFADAALYFGDLHFEVDLLFTCHADAVFDRRLFREGGCRQPQGQVGRGDGCHRTAEFNPSVELADNDVFERFKQSRTQAVMTRVQAAEGNLWQRFIETGCTAFIESLSDKSAQRIIFTDGPSVLDPDIWHKNVQAVDLIGQVLGQLATEGFIEEAPHKTLARLVWGSFLEAGVYISHAPDAVRAQHEMLQGLKYLLGKLRIKHES